MASSNKKVQTLNDLIRYGKTSSFSLPSVSFLQKRDNVIYLDQLVYNKYKDLINDKAMQITLTTVEYNKYKLNPKLLSYDLYGTPNLDHLILWLNNTSEFEFDTYTIKLIPKSIVRNLLNSILVHEESNIKKSSNFKG